MTVGGTFRTSSEEGRAAAPCKTQLGYLKAPNVKIATSSEEALLPHRFSSSAKAAYVFAFLGVFLMLLNKTFTSVSPNVCLCPRVYKVWPIANVYRNAILTLNSLKNSGF